jgi:hypothetical protein
LLAAFKSRELALPKQCSLQGADPAVRRQLIDEGERLVTSEISAEPRRLSKPPRQAPGYEQVKENRPLHQRERSANRHVS